MSVRFTPGLDDLAHPVRDAKLLAQFWPFFFVGAARKSYDLRIHFVVSLGPKIVSESDSSGIVTLYRCRLQISSRLERRLQVSFPRLH